MRRLAFLSLFATLLLGCQSVQTGAKLPPTPYSAEEIREECLPGTRLLFGITDKGSETVHQEMVFLGGDDESARFRVVQPVGSGRAMEASATWIELRDHAAFDPMVTSRRRESITVGAGTFKCWHYAVPVAEEAVEHYWFAVDKPGPPVLLEVRGQGKILSRMELLEYERPAPR